MEHHQKSMARKWERHFMETKTTVAYGLIMFGFCVGFPLVFLYPQKFAVDVFNSRLIYHLILDVEDYLTCNKQYESFIVDDPQPVDAMHSFYIFNVTNAADIIQRGYKPVVAEIGPYAYTKLVYKYDVSFHPVDFDTLTFKEFSVLREVTDPNLCQLLFFKLGRAFGQYSNPCLNGACDCKSPSDVITIINPLFFKTLWHETSQTFLAQFTQPVFSAIKDMLENDFVHAIKAHLVPTAFKEITYFRLQCQSSKLLATAFTTLRSNYSFPSVISLIENAPKSTFPTTCGLGVYGITDSCPMNAYQYLKSAKSSILSINGNFSLENFPHIGPLFNASLNISLLHQDVGSPHWVGACFCLGITSFQGNYKGYTMMDTNDCNSILSELHTGLATAYFGTLNVTQDQLLASSAIVQAVATWLARAWLTPTRFTSVLTTLNTNEFIETSDPVPCSPMLDPCVWQWGHMPRHYHSTDTVSASMAYQFISDSNQGLYYPANFYYVGNSAPYYNSFKYCTEVLPRKTGYDTCSNLEHTFQDALVTVPSNLYAIDTGFPTTNRSAINNHFTTGTTADVRQKYLYFGCNVSTFFQRVYPNTTDFHDKYVIRFLNKFKEPLLTDEFTVGNWKQLGWAQFGSGAITYAVVGVRTITQIVRDGPWVIGNSIGSQYVKDMVEISTWAIKQGHPTAWIYNTTDAHILLSTLALANPVGQQFREFLITTGTTLVGNGKSIINGVGAVGDRAFLNQVTDADFACTGPNQAACSILRRSYPSSADYCDDIEDMYMICVKRLFAGNICERAANTALTP